MTTDPSGNVPSSRLNPAEGGAPTPTRSPRLSFSEAGQAHCPMGDIITTTNFQKKIKIVCFGGGTGMPAVLSGLKLNPFFDITAVVSMFDEGGGTGELRDRFGILPPGDVVRCLLALSKNEAMAREILYKRITHSKYPNHTGGNVLLMGLEQVFGNYHDAVDALGQILSVRGKVEPVSLDKKSSLKARFDDGSVAPKEPAVDAGMIAGKHVENVYLEPRARATKETIQAVKEADILCAGPGNIYTSIIPNFLPDGITDALKKSKAPLIYVANLVTEGNGMKERRPEELVEIVERYAKRKVQAVIVNTKLPSKQTLNLYAKNGKHPITPAKNSKDKRIVVADLWFDESIARHDSARLAQLIFALATKLLG